MRMKKDGAIESDAVDAVFVIGTGSSNANEELRYALRNLDEHCRFIRDVYICGECPPWIDRSSVIHLKWPDRFRHAKDANIIDKLRHACEHPGIAKRVLFCSDDQFQTRPCTWDDFAPRYLRRYFSSDKWYSSMHRVWHSRLRKTLEREVARRRSAGIGTNSVFYYQPHIWMQIDRDSFIEYAKWSQYDRRDDTIIASGYFNFVEACGRQDFDHVFIGSGDRVVPNVTHVAYNDSSYGAAMAILKTLFPNPSRFEVPYAASREIAKKSAMHLERQACHVASISSCDDPSPATSDESSTLNDVMKKIRSTPEWNGLLGEVSRAEELRLFGVPGWRVVWSDIVMRWSDATRNGSDKVPVRSARSKESARIVDAYVSNPDSVRTVRFGISNKHDRTGMRGPSRISDGSFQMSDDDRKALHRTIREALRRKASL